MYKLYSSSEKTLLDMNKDEGEIINTLCEYMKAYLNIGFEIECDETPYKSIKSVSDFYHYVNDYNVKKNTEKLKQMSCLELKREMLELSDKKRIKIKGRQI